MGSLYRELAQARIAEWEREGSSLVPNLVEVQLQSYEWFLKEALRELFDNFSPIEDFTGTLSLEFLDYNLGEPKYAAQACRDRDMTFEMPLKVKVRLVNKETGELKESEVYLGEIPCMTDKGTFVINGAERVVVNQLSRSPGVYFSDELDFSGRVLLRAQVIPREGAWVDLESDASDVISVKVGQARKTPATVLLRAFNALPGSMPHGDVQEFIKPTKGRLRGRVLAEPLIDFETGELIADANTHLDTGLAARIAERVEEQQVAVYKDTLECSTTLEILSLMAERVAVKEVSVEQLQGCWTASDLIDQNGEVAVPAGTYIDQELAETLATALSGELEVLRASAFLTETLRADPTTNQDEALLEIHKRLRPGDPPTHDSARALLNSYFLDVKRYDLGRVGRYKLNTKLAVTVPEDIHTFTKEDLIAVFRYLEHLSEGEGETDDIDHLRNKRVRSVGELLQNQLRVGFLRMERVARERMTSLDRESITAQTVISIKPITAAVRSFFGSGQLSQFMDQTNPLAELTHKRRLSALGPGGLSRQSAKLEVRDVHHSHYGRICPIETPEGPNIGLINSLATHARTNQLGFILSPYRKVKDGRVTDEIVYLTAEDDDRHRIAPANTPLDEKQGFASEEVQVRFGSIHPVVSSAQVEYMDISPMQVYSVATCCIPFLGNDDANRALMGSNMQRQAVPLVRPEAPRVGTGMESRAAIDSGAVIVAHTAGVVEEVAADHITVKGYEGHSDRYPLYTFVRSNQATCIHQRPVVRLGQRVREGTLLADGPAIDNGNMALGRNLLCAFALWEGFNYEDAILLSERVSRDDLLTSIHIEKYEIEARETKLGPEEITRDIPNVGEELLGNLDEDGVIRMGAQVGPEDILVGKVAPKSHGELTAEERLVIAIFGKKAEEMRDASLRVPHGDGGMVVGIRIFARHHYVCAACNKVHRFQPLDLSCAECGGKLVQRPGDELKPGTTHLVRVYLAQRRKVVEGDKLAGRHGNKGVIARILPDCDMPYMPDGTPVDIVLNPLGVPSRMNIGQILETHLGLVGRTLGTAFPNPVFRSASEDEIRTGMREVESLWRVHALARLVGGELTLCDEQEFEGLSWEEASDRVRTVLTRLPAAEAAELAEEIALPAETLAAAAGETALVEPLLECLLRRAVLRAGFDAETGKCVVRDGRTGEAFNQPVVVGEVYMMKLNHLVDDKIHARSTGPYSLVTQQPLGGKAQFGGQRFGEMEVWALEAYGAAHLLQEMLTIKSDDMVGRVKAYEAIVKGERISGSGVPESFKILIKELQSLGLQITVESEDGEAMELRDADEDTPDTDVRM